MDIGLVIVGDEVLSGRRRDAHLPKVVEMLTSRGLVLSWVTILGDDKALLDSTYARTFAGNDLVFSTGGIGATPDDMTRESVARVLGTTVERHPEGKLILEDAAEKRNRPVTDNYLRLIEFPVGANLIPNPINRIPGFSVNHHHFVPGFPEMAWPMIEWVLDTHYSHLVNNQYQEKAVMVSHQFESAMIPILEEIEREHPAVKVFCLPITSEDFPKNEIGVKGHASDVKLAFDHLRQILKDHNYQWERIN